MNLKRANSEQLAPPQVALHWKAMSENLFSDMDGGGTNQVFTAHCDGGSRGNPGPSGYGAVIEDAQGRVAAELSEFVGIQTNNFAEYSGLLGVLRWSIEHGVRQLRVISDSELMVKQMQGRYAVKSPILRPLFEEARKLSRKLEKFEMSHTLRGGNKVADRLANEAMDRGMGKSAIPRVGKPEDFEAARRAGQRTSGPASQPVSKAARQTLEGYVKNGVVHLLGGELPEGSFVKVVYE
jgi:probable phosphoglycerate mutase